MLAQRKGALSARKEEYLPVDVDLKCMCAYTYNPPIQRHLFLICVTSAKITSEGVEAQINTRMLCQEETGYMLY